ncbi:MAG: hypothetical protein JEY94_01405 [Melioribacteraceae bacterium]|nr:hypothetical protein [Melioribacteraceae bacterium]
MKKSFLCLLIISIITACSVPQKTNNNIVDSIRFFSDQSFWNQPIAKDVKIDERSDYWINLLERDPSGENFGLNVDAYTIPIYEVDSTIKRITIKQITSLLNEKGEVDCEFGHSIKFDELKFPMPDHVIPSPGADQHLAVFDRKSNLIWDMFLVKKDKDGAWESATGMVYPLDGTGVFNKDEFNVQVGTSIHGHGPGVAAGMPIVAGVIRYDEIKQGKINHKLSGALRYTAYQEFVFPAVWTDGNFEGGIPEGAVIQLDPELDLSAFDLTTEEKIVAKAMQEYGIVIVDFSEGSTIRAEYLDKSRGLSWNGKLRGWKDPGGIKTIPVSNYRVLEVGETFKGGDKEKKFFTEKLYFIE